MTAEELERIILSNPTVRVAQLRTEAEAVYHATRIDEHDPQWWREKAIRLAESLDFLDQDLCAGAALPEAWAPPEADRAPRVERWAIGLVLFAGVGSLVLSSLLALSCSPERCWLIS